MEQCRHATGGRHSSPFLERCQESLPEKQLPPLATPCQGGLPRTRPSGDGRHGLAQNRAASCFCLLASSAPSPSAGFSWYCNPAGCFGLFFCVGSCAGGKGRHVTYMSHSNLMLCFTIFGSKSLSQLFLPSLHRNSAPYLLSLSCSDGLGARSR